MCTRIAAHLDQHGLWKSVRRADRRAHEYTKKDRPAEINHIETCVSFVEQSEGGTPNCTT